MITGEMLADIVWDWASGNQERVERILRAQGKVIEQHDGFWIVRSDGFNCGLMLNASAIDALPQLMFALFGPLWPHAVGDAFDKAQTMLSKRVRELKRQAKKESAARFAKVAHVGVREERLRWT